MLLLLTREVVQRNSIVPQMVDYDRLGSVWRPYLMYFHTPNYKSSVVNTDSEGFRYSTYGDQPISPTSLAAGRTHRILVGGSTAFGVGSESDDSTIASHLARSTSSPWLNMAGRAFTSVQEYLLFAAYHSRIPKIDTVVLLSGFNNLFLAQRALPFTPPLGSFFYQQAFEAGMELFTKDRRARLRSTLFGRSLTVPTQQRSISEAIRLAVELTHQSLQLWDFAAKARGIRLVFALQPTAHWSARSPHPNEATLFSLLRNIDPALTATLERLDDSCYSEYRERLAHVCQNLGITFLDINTHLRTTNNQDEWWHVDRVHYTSIGNERISDAISSVL